MQVTGLTAATLIIPLRTGTSIANRTMTERHYTLVRVATDGGVEGLGFCYCGNAAGWVVTSAVRDLLARHVVGHDSHHTEGIWDAMYADALLLGRRGVVLRAMSAIDIALWDANAKAAQLPLYRYLGAARGETVPAYASGGYYLPGKSEQDLAAECAGYVDAGYTAVKIKVGRVDARADAARIAAARAAVGDEVELFADANNAWPDAASAIRAIRRWDEYDLGWVEEPNPPDELAAHAAVAAAVEPPIATGEIHQTRWDFQHILDLGAAAILQPDAAVWRRHHRVPAHRRPGGRPGHHRGPALARRPARALGGRHPERHLGRVLHRHRGVEPDGRVPDPARRARRRSGSAAAARPRHRARRRRRGTLLARRLALSAAHLKGAPIRSPGAEREESRAG